MTHAAQSPDPAVPTRVRLEGLALAAALVTVTLWASAFVGIRAVAPHLSPGPFALGRLVVGVLALTLVVAIRRPKMPPRRALPLLIGCGVLWFATYTVVLNTAERFVDAGTAAMLVNVGPILIAILGGLFLGEGFPKRLFAGCLIAFAGAIIIGLATSEANASPNATMGIVLCLVAATAYAIGVTLQKPVVATTPAVTVAWVSCAFGAIACVPFAPQLLEELDGAQTEAIAWLVYLGIFPTAVAFTTWAYALSRTTAGRLGSTTYLVPALAILMGWALLGEAPAPLALLGGVVAIAGVVIARWTPARGQTALAQGGASQSS